MRILYLNPIGALGGAERSLLDIFAALRALEPKWELHLIAGAEGALIGEAAKMSVRAEVLPMPEELLVLGDSAIGRTQADRNVRPTAKFGAAFRLLKRGAKAALSARRYAAQLRARVAVLRPDLIHSNGIKFHVLTRMMGKVSAPVVWHIRDFIGARRLMSRALRWAAPAASQALANSEAVAVDGRRVLTRVAVRTVLNCIDTDYFSPGAAACAQLDELAGLPAESKGTLRVGMLASYARWKGQDLFLRAAAELRKSAPELAVRFYVVGGPIYKTQGSQFSLDELRALARELGIAECVGFVAFQDQPVEIYRALDVVVHASTQPEPFGRTIAEAMSCGRAAIATMGGGVGELFTPGVEALAVRANDAGELALRIEWLLKNARVREELGLAARAVAVQRFSRARMGRELREVYGGLVRGV
ncbi:MAG TPA: glycosyltransferase family 4 protein [Planctomycetota bacterium]|nr:glycosyltransferase family 4 protein [Planctomycetota bacterium]